MNIYIVVEGVAELIIYPEWISVVNPQLSQITNPSQVNQDNYYIISGKGYPKIFDAIDGAINDVITYPQFNRIVISSDSEDMTREDKYNEYVNYLAGKLIPCEVRIIIQHFCLETWALGNRKILGQTSNLEKLRDYRRLYDVRSEDPELLPDKPDEELNRARFAKKYLRLVINNASPRMTYRESKPRPINEVNYFREVRKRFLQTNHIRSFNDFLSAFI